MLYRISNWMYGGQISHGSAIWLAGEIRVLRCVPRDCLGVRALMEVVGGMVYYGV